MRFQLEAIYKRILSVEGTYIQHRTIHIRDQRNSKGGWEQNYYVMKILSTIKKEIAILWRWAINKGYFNYNWY